LTAPARRAAKLGLTRDEAATLCRLSTPAALQDFITALPINHEPDGDTLYTVRQVLRHRRAHCIEAALVAACALWIHGEAPLLIDFQAHDDYDHVAALFRRGGRWGTISKSNHVALRHRDPVYRTLRELAMSYFHEYHDVRGRKSLRTYSRAFDLRRLDPASWVTGEADAWALEAKLDATRHYALIDARHERFVRGIDAMEWRAKRIIEYPPPRGRRGGAS